MSNRGVNKVILIGNLGQDPEIRYIPNGGVVANISLATTENWKDKDTREIKSRTEWHRVVVFGKLAEVVREYLKKGSQIYVEGSIRTRKWHDKNGYDRYVTEIVVNMSGMICMLGNRYPKVTDNNNVKNSDIWNKNNYLNSPFEENIDTSDNSDNNNIVKSIQDSLIDNTSSILNKKKEKDIVDDSDHQSSLSSEFEDEIPF